MPQLADQWRSEFTAMVGEAGKQLCSRVHRPFEAAG